MELIEKYREYLKNIQAPKPYSDKTINSYCNDVAAFMRFVNKSVESVTHEDIEDFLLEGAPATGRRRFSSVLNFYEYLNKSGVTDNKPISKEMYESLRQDPERLSEKMTIPEGIKFLDEARKSRRTYAIMMLFLNTGIREAELFNLQREDYRVETNMKGEQEASIRIIRKGNKEALIPVNEGALNAVNDYLATRRDDIPYLFISNQNRQYSPSGLFYLVTTIAERAGISKNITPHILRHTFAAMMWDNGADPVQIMQILGHKSIKTTLRYLGKLGIHKARELMNNSAFNVR